jgi:hypothetical protein
VTPLGTCPRNDRALAAIVEEVVDKKNFSWVVRCGVDGSGGVGGGTNLEKENGRRRGGKRLPACPGLWRLRAHHPFSFRSSSICLGYSPLPYYSSFRNQLQYVAKPVQPPPLSVIL